MEVKNSLKDYVVVFDNIFQEEHLVKFHDVLKNHKNFGEAAIVDKQGLKVEKKTRNALVWPLGINLESMTEVHWANYCSFKIQEGVTKYAKITRRDFNLQIKDIQALKYEVGGHYVIHHDHCKEEPRTLSIIIFVNDDYEGGNVEFHLPDANNKLIVDKKKNRMVIFPSNFLYQHAVQPVTKGVRYSIVSWML